MIGNIGYVGCNPLWEHELRKLSKLSLLHVIDHLALWLSMRSAEFPHDMMLKLVGQSKRSGNCDAILSRMESLNADPQRYWESRLRRQRGAKSAARRRKTASRRAAKDARQ